MWECITSASRGSRDFEIIKERNLALEDSYLVQVLKGSWILL